jgi:hypothetical protein
MTGYQIISDLQRVVALEARSARPEAPVHPVEEQAPRTPRVASLRLRMTIALRRLADVLEPATMETVPNQKSSPC